MNPVVIERDARYVSATPRFPSPVVEGADEFIGLSFHMATRVGRRGVGGLTPAHRARAHLLFHLRREFPFVREFREARVPTVATQDMRHEVSGQFRPTST